MTQTTRWARKSIVFTGRGRWEIKAEELPPQLKLPWKAEALGESPTMVEVKTRCVDGEPIPTGLTIRELKWFMEVADRHGIEIETKTEEKEFIPDTHNAWAPDPCIRTDYLDAHFEEPSGLTDDWLLKWSEQTEIIPNTVQEDNDEVEWISIKHGFFVNMVRDWDDLSATHTEKEADVEVRFEWGSNKLIVNLSTTSNALWLDDPILKGIIKRVSDTWRQTLTDPNEFEANCEGLMGAERTESCDPSYFQAIEVVE
jgi:hypothetical protein